MTTEQFTYWLQGFMEIANPTTLNEQQVQEIKNHLALTLHKVTPVVMKSHTEIEEYKPLCHPGTNLATWVSC